MIPRVLPFVTYLGFLIVEQIITWLSGKFYSSEVWMNSADLWLYPIKTAVVLSLLIHFWPRYRELEGKAFSDKGSLYLTIAVGLMVYVAWVRMDWTWAMQGSGVSSGYDPFRAGTGAGALLACVRIFGASAVVPIMEELFWRSFLLRYLVSPQFESVRLGAITPTSFLATVILFGLEHDLWLAGMMAGIAYTFLLIRTHNLWSCILAHGVTNFALGIHVLVTGEWKWW